MNRAHKSFAWLFFIVFILAGIGVYGWYRTFYVGTKVEVHTQQTPPPPSTIAPVADSPEEFAGDSRILVYANGRKSGDAKYYGTEPDVITVLDPILNKSLATIKTTITPDSRGVGNQYVLVGDMIYFYHQTDRMVEAIDFTGKVAKLSFTQSPLNRSYQNFVISKDGSKIAWSRSAKGSGANLRTAMWVANIDGSGQKLVQEKELGPEKYFSLFRFSKDNTSLYYAEEAGGRGGYILFSGFSNLQKVSFTTGEVTRLYNEPKSFITDMTDDELQVTGFGYLQTKPVIVYATLDNEGIVTKTIASDAGFTVGGSVFVSPDNKHMAYTLAASNPNNEQYGTFVSGVTSDAEPVSIADNEKCPCRVLKWISNSRILLRSDIDPTQLYVVNADGTGFAELVIK